jgi:hypothetical protein
LELTGTGASGISGYCPYLLKYQDFFKYELHVKGTVLYLWGFVRCIKCSNVVYYMRFKYPHRAMVVLPLESDGACTGLDGRSAGKMWYWFNL